MRERKEISCLEYGFWNSAIVWNKKKLIWKIIYSDAEIVSGNSPAQIPRQLIRRWILIQPLNVGDKGVAEIKWRHALVTKTSRASPRKVDTYCYDSTSRSKAIREIRRGYQYPPFLPRSWKTRFWGAIVGANWSHRYCSHGKGLGLWPNTQSQDKSVSEDNQ